jgi:hypothetical protein
MWVDELKTRYLNEEVEVVRAIESPATPDEYLLPSRMARSCGSQWRGIFPLVLAMS